MIAVISQPLSANQGCQHRFVQAAAPHAKGARLTYQKARQVDPAGLFRFLRERSEAYFAFSASVVHK
jgi:hypothetical protein